MCSRDYVSSSLPPWPVKGEETTKTPIKGRLAKGRVIIGSSIYGELQDLSIILD